MWPGRNFITKLFLQCCFCLSTAEASPMPTTVPSIIGAVCVATLIIGMFYYILGPKSKPAKRNNGITDLTKEDVYYVRLDFLVTNVGTDVVTETFDNMPMFAPKELSKTLGLKRESEEIKRVSCWKKLYPSRDKSVIWKSTDSIFDITMMFALITNLSKPLPGAPNADKIAWESKKDFLKVIKDNRNAVSHLRGSCINKEEFEHMWKDISNSILSLANPGSIEKYKAWMKKISKMTLHNFKTDYSNIDNPEHFFSRHSEGTRTLESLMKHGKVVLIGPHGSGKTLLAKHLACLLHNRENLKEEFPTLNPSFLDTAAIRCGQQITVCKSKLKLEGATIDKFRSSLIEVFGLIGEPLPAHADSVNYIFNQLLDHLERCGGYHVLLIDNLTEETRAFFERPFSKTVFILFTTNNQTLLRRYQVKIEGLEQEDTISFFREKMAESETSQENEADIKDFGNFFDNLPLGLSVGVAALQSTGTSIKRYLETLKNSSPTQKEKLIEAGKSGQGGYKENLISAFQKAINGSRFGTPDGPVPSVAQIMRLAIYMDSRNLSKKLLKAIGLHLGLSEADAEATVADLICELKKTSLGQSAGIDDQAHVCIHECVQFAWLMNLFEADTHHQSLEFLHLHCDKDNRTLTGFQSSAFYLPHIHEAIRHFDEFQGTENINVMSQILKVQLLDVIGHYCCQMQEPLRGKEYTEKAKKLFYDQILKMSEQEKMAVVIYEKLEQTDIDQVKSLARTERLKRKYSKKDQEEWKLIVPDLENNCDYIDSNGCLKENRLQDLQDMNVILSEEDLAKIFLVEVFMSVLYTGGRVYFYLKDRMEFSLDERTKYEKSLQLAFELGRFVKDRNKIHLMQYTLSLRQGVLQMKLEGKGKTEQQLREDYMYASEEYNNLLVSTGKCYQRGMLKSCLSLDVFHKFQCMKQICRCLGVLIDTSEDPMVEYDREKSKMEDMEKMLGENKEEINLADFYNQLAGVYSKLAKKANNDQMAMKALDLYKKAFDSAHAFFSSRLRFNHTPREAIIGLVNVFEEYPIKDREVQVTACLKKYEVMIEKAKADSEADFSKEEEVAEDSRRRFDGARSNSCLIM